MSTFKIVTRNRISRTSDTTRAAVFAFGSIVGLSENSAGKSGEQQLNNLWSGRFVKNKMVTVITMSFTDEKSGID